MTDRDGNAVSTLILVGEDEYLLCASRGRVLFDNYSCSEACSQLLTISLDRHSDSISPTEDAGVPIILSIPSTPRFELSAAPFECLLTLRSPQTYTIKFIPPTASESDYAWDNFQDQVVVHTRLSKLVIRLDAWKLAVPTSLSPEQESTLLFPVSLPDVKAPPLRRFGALERNADEKDPTQRHRAPSPSFTETPSVLKTKCLNVLPPLSRPSSSERQAEASAEQPFKVAVAAVQSQREAQEVILKLRRRRTHQNNSKVSLGTSPTSVADTELFPETVGLDASTKADLEEFNSLVVAAKDQVTKETAKAKTELAYYQQLLPKPPSRDSASDLGSSTTALKPGKTRHLSAAMMRPSKLPSLVRPSSGAAPSSDAVNNQEISGLEQAQYRRLSARQRITRKTKLQSLSGSQTKANNQLQTLHDDELSDFDDPDPEVDDAPTIPDDLSGVATLEVDDYLPV
ncbi:hypothetical protein V7S43_013317 [Phytophthora oleae]|uniref:PIH1 N-terminal domain-containing protein n=1 Tax=Phytophthora oleae TaxID=2107226 RepID=A0ABD3F501_9STRA